MDDAAERLGERHLPSFGSAASTFSAFTAGIVMYSAKRARRAGDPVLGACRALVRVARHAAFAERQPRRAHAVAAPVDDDAIADGQVAHRGARLLDDADELVPENLR